MTTKSCHTNGFFASRTKLATRTRIEARMELVVVGSRNVLSYLILAAITFVARSNSHPSRSFTVVVSSFAATARTTSAQAHGVRKSMDFLKSSQLQRISQPTGPNGSSGWDLSFTDSLRSRRPLFVLRGGGEGSNGSSSENKDQQQKQPQRRYVTPPTTPLLSPLGYASCQSPPLRLPSTFSSATRTAGTTLPSTTKTTTRLYATARPTVNTPNDEESILQDPSFSRMAQQLHPVERFGGLTFWNTRHRDAAGSNSPPLFRVLFVLGGPGVGKGTQCDRMMSEQYPIVHLSAGHLLRQAANQAAQQPNQQPQPFSWTTRNTSLSLETLQLVQEALRTGRIVPVEITIELLLNAMQRYFQDNPTRDADVLFVIDGFPRNFNNLAGWCRHRLVQANVSLWGVLVYHCPVSILEERILHRAATSVTVRSDDNLEALHKRIRTYRKETVPVIDAMRRLENDTDGSCLWHVYDIAADGTVDAVWQETCRQVLHPLLIHDVLSANAALLQAVREGNVEAYQELCDPSWFDFAVIDKDTDVIGKGHSKHGKHISRWHQAKTKMIEYEGLSVLEQQESNKSTSMWEDSVTHASVQIISAQHVVVRYQRLLPTTTTAMMAASSSASVQVEETRVWVRSLPSGGWRTVHFSRTPTTA